ncbi:hypothetical protein PVAP13_4NG337533 [Panicum virgatum]|uniref:Uncharacterized protein n=1 Tax=Panicum virgatum TaxID=38727 RepID=A0A8T0THK3_PANVG|nr:hypothetical protein PVAP13_4NG337533 [Panicum virgatum]
MIQPDADAFTFFSSIPASLIVFYISFYPSSRSSSLPPSPLPPILLPQHPFLPFFPSPALPPLPSSPPLPISLPPTTVAFAYTELHIPNLHPRLPICSPPAIAPSAHPHPYPSSPPRLLLSPPLPLLVTQRCAGPQWPSPNPLCQRRRRVWWSQQRA